MIRLHDRKAMAALAAVALIAPPFGCGGPAPVDPGQAHATLAMALDAWRDGRTIEDVNRGSPPIIIGDPSWKSGARLSRYQIGDPARAAGFDLKIPVELWLEGPRGKPVQQKVKYTVSVQPARTVVRAPM